MENKVSSSSSQILKAKREFCRNPYQIDPSDRKRVKRNLFSDKSETCELARKAKEVDLKLSQMLSEKKKLKKKQLLNQKQLTLMFKEKKRLDQMKMKTNPPPPPRKESRSSNTNVSDITKKYKRFDRPNRKESRSSNANDRDITKKYKHFDRPKVHKNVFKKKKRVSHSLQSFGEAFSNEDFGFGNGKRLNVDLDGTFTDPVFSPTSKHCFNKESKKAGHFLRC